MKCKWCKDTGLYYPLVGEAEPCRECEQHSKLLWTPETKTIFVPGLSSESLIVLAEGYLSNLDAINAATKKWITQSNLVDKVFATDSIFGHLMKEFYTTPRKIHVLGESNSTPFREN